MVFVALATTAATMAAQSEQAHAQGNLIKQQSELQANQVAQAAGQQESEAAMRARAARSQAAVAASAAGVNLGSNSFLASIQTTTMNQANENGLILQNESNQQGARVAQTDSLLASKATSPTFLGAAVDMALAGSDAYMKADAAKDAGIKSRGTTGAGVAGG